MSKVFEALEHAYEVRHEVIKDFPVKRSSSQPTTHSTLPPLQMEREMVQLQQRLAGFLSDPEHNILQFISCTKHEGVSTIAQEFARVLVEKQGKSVLLIDGDSQKMTQHLSCGISPKISLQQISNNGGDVAQAITSVIPSRLFLARLSGDKQETVPVASVSKQDIWVHIRKKFDMIVIDAPSLDTSDEGVALFPVVDGVVIIVEAEKTRSKVISHLKDQIEHSGGNLLGLVFNKQRHYIPKWLYRRL